MGIGTEREREEARIQALWANTQYEMLVDLFWISCYATHPDLHNKSIGIRKDWKLVWFDEEPADTAEHALGVLLIRQLSAGDSLDTPNAGAPHDKNLH